ncbi:molybdenum ABC transporter ATP-binding protein [Afifella sp. IM 167]|uniref:molybdenum ABC transporter ATP-binding protein n=1 Tax=Afifella sp. IM 167 TaxID=2033586 RepID=UPI001CCF1385|nr:molybdenum ABC transporter ATP-binding protein [Afifella sp. IM 167]MBZ8132872.1 molybdenum ABC transporter ATP-binding protein [Afifella sp. IM 167]
MEEPGTIDLAFTGRFGGFALNAAFCVPARGVIGIFGPSGCGKTSVLRCAAGLQRLEGYLSLAGEVWQDAATFRPAHRRPIGYVFQEASLFPHLSVRRNILYGAPRRRPPRPGEGTGLEEVVELLGIGHLLDRSPARLSGGERQRVAIGRALLSQPRLLLMDEPLSALDRQTKDGILPFLERLHERLAIPVLYVSHDIGELERLADHLVLMEEGRVIASGKLSELQSDPALPLATSREAAVSLDAIVTGYDPAYGIATLAVDGGEIVIPSPAGRPGTPRRLRVGAGDVSLARKPPESTTIINILPARILAHRPVGPHERLIVLGLGEDGSGARLLSRVTLRSFDHLALAEGMLVYAQVKGVALAPSAATPERTTPA